MKRKRFSEEQIVGILNEAPAGATAVEACWRHGISEITLYRWQAKVDGLAVSEHQAAAPARGGSWRRRIWTTRRSRQNWWHLQLGGGL